MARTLATASYTPPKPARGSAAAPSPNPRIGFTTADGSRITNRPTITAAPLATTPQSTAGGGYGAATTTPGGFSAAGTVNPRTGAPTGVANTNPAGYNDNPQGYASLPGDPWTGFASRYNPGAADMMLSNPSQIFYDVAKQMGLASADPMGDQGYTQMLAPYADLMPYLYDLFNASNPNAGSREAQVNFASQFAKNMLTPGGRDISLPGMMSQIYGQPAVQGLYRTGNPAQNVNTLNDMVNMTAGLSFNPMLQKMVQAATDKAAYEYLSQTAQGQNPGAYDTWLRQNTPQIGSFFG